MKILFLLCSVLFSISCYSKNIKIIVPYSPGGSTDRVCRVLQAELSNKDYNFILEYKTGAGGSLAAKYVASVKNDTVLFVPSNNLITAPLLTVNPPYDVLQNFTFVDYIGAEPSMVLVKNNTGIKSYLDLVNKSKVNPMPYGSAGVGTSSHISAAIVANNNPNFIHIPFKGGAAALMELLAGNVKWIVDSDIIAGEFIANGQLKPLAIVGKHRIQKYPSVPTLTELGVNDYGIYRWFILVSNSDANPAIIDYVRSKTATPEFKKKINDLGIQTEKPEYIKHFLSYETIQTEKMLKKVQLE